ncbi:MAG: peptidase M28, partial [Flavobacteriales bacterium]
MGFGQGQEQVIAAIQKEANDNSQLEQLAHELMDVIGPRLVGTPQMKAANDWAVATYAKWGIEAKNEAWGQWKGWKRGITHIDMLSPRLVSLKGMQLAWSPSTSKKG